MLARSLMVGFSLCVAALVGCGGPPKQADDASDQPKSIDDTPKWEGSPTTSQAGNPDNKPKTAGGGVAPVEQPKQRSDQYDKEGTEVALKRAARQVKENCGQAKDDQGKATGPWGKATVQVQLGHNGHSKGITVPPPYQGKVTGNCVEKAFTNLQFPPWQGADTEVPWEVEIVEPGKEKK